MIKLAMKVLNKIQIHKPKIIMKIIIALYKIQFHNLRFHNDLYITLIFIYKIIKIIIFYFNFNK